MALSLKERYARLDTSKLPEEFNKRFDSIKEKTDNFSDEDVLDIWEKPFNTLYEIVERKHPEAIKKGGKIIKEKPAKVKTVERKKEKVPSKVEITPAMRKKLSAKDIEFIEMTLNNDEADGDEELVDHFVKELGISKSQAEKWVALRSKYLTLPVDKSLSYSVRTKQKKAARKSSDKNIAITRDGYDFNRKDPKMKGKKFFDENGKEWTCKGYDAKLDDCIMEDADGKEIASCLREMYVNNPVTKREKGNLVDECKDTLKKAGYSVKEHKAGEKKVKRSEPRPEKEIIKERVESTFTPILKDISGSEEKDEKYKDTIAALERVQKLFTKLFNRLSNLAEDNKADAIEKIEKLLEELVG